MQAFGEEEPGLWRRSAAWRWVLSGTILLSAVVALLAPWHRPIPPPVPPLASYAPQPATPSVPSRGTPRPAPAPSLPSMLDPDPPVLSAPVASGSAPPATPGSNSSGVRWQPARDGTVSGGGLVAEYCCAGAFSTVYPTVSVSQGKHYLELSLSVRPGATGPDTWTDAGLAAADDKGPQRPTRAGSGDSLSLGARRTLAHGDVVMMAIDMDAGLFYWGVNGKWHNGDPGAANGAALRKGVAYRPFVSISASSSKQTPEGDKWIANFGSRPFKYAPPASYSAYASTSTVRIGSTTEPMAADAYTGRFFTDAVTIGGLSAPLPEGRWRGLAHVKRNDPPDETVLLGRIAGERLLELAAIRVQSQPTGEGFDRFASCGRDDLYAREVVVNQKGGEQLCWWVNHAVRVWNQPTFNLAAANLSALKVPVPPTMINSGFRKASKGSAVTAFFYVNPESGGFNEPSEDWRSSPWHRDNVPASAQRKAYMDSRVEWTRNWLPLFKAAR